MRRQQRVDRERRWRHMTIPTAEAPLRTITHSRTFRMVGLGLILLIDIVIILWMTSGQPSDFRLIKPITSPMTANDAPRSLYDGTPETAAAATGRGAATKATPVTQSHPRGAAGAARLFDTLREAAAPAFSRGATPVRSTAPSNPAGASSAATVVAAPGPSTAEGRAPRASTHGPGSASYFPLPTGMAEIIGVMPTPSAPGTAGSGIGGAPPTATVPTLPGGGSTGGGAQPPAGPTPSDTPTNDPRPSDTPTNSPQPSETPTKGPASGDKLTKDPRPSDTPAADPTPTDDSTAQPTPTAAEPTASEPTAAEPTARATKTRRPGCTLRPCRPRAKGWPLTPRHP